jgi:hypothetical protein
LFSHWFTLIVESELDALSSKEDTGLQSGGPVAACVHK